MRYETWEDFFTNFQKQKNVLKDLANFWEVQEIHDFHGGITREFLKLRMQNFQGIFFMWTQPHR